MIPFPLQEAELLDRYSVLIIKRDYGMDVDAEIRAFSAVVGTLLDDAIRSQEFKQLNRINGKIFRLVEKARVDKCKASEVALANDERHKAKCALQKKWFNSSLVESKTGIVNE